MKVNCKIIKLFIYSLTWGIHVEFTIIKSAIYETIHVVCWLHCWHQCWLFDHSFIKIVMFICVVLFAKTSLMIAWINKCTISVCCIIYHLLFLVYSAIRCYMRWEMHQLYHQELCFMWFLDNKILKSLHYYYFFQMTFVDFLAN